MNYELQIPEFKIYQFKIKALKLILTYLQNIKQLFWMHNNSVGQRQSSKLAKSPVSRARHVREDSSVQRSSKLKIAQSCRRITTQQNDKIVIKLNDNQAKKQSEGRLSRKKYKICTQPPPITLIKQNKYSSCKDIKNLKLSSSVNKNIQNYLHLFSPKLKDRSNQNSSKDGISKDQSINLMSKSTLKKAGGNKANVSTKVNKISRQQKITPFIVHPSNGYEDKLLKSPTNAKCIKKMTLNTVKHLKPLLKFQGQTKSKVLKTLQNQHLSIFKHGNYSKDQLQTVKQGIKKNTEKSKIYQNVKIKTQQSMISCQSTPSQIFTDDIDIIQLIGEGTFGKVYKALIKKRSQIVAIKRVFQDRKYKNRQVEIVSMLTESNFIMRVMGTYMTYEGKNSQNPQQYLNIVMKYYESDLYKQIQNKNGLKDIQIKIYTYQIFRGLLYLHSKDICHRDIKPHNILTHKMSVAICDFGSAKILNPQQRNLSYICSRCYRAPQLIFGSTQYTTMIDIWSVGCIILQMIHGSPFFIGNSSIDHLIEVIKVLGTPTKSQVKQMNPEYDLKDYKFPNIKSKSFAKLFTDTDPLLLSLLEQIMIYAPKQRLNAAQALVHEYFDQLREESFCAHLYDQFNLPDFFDFTPQQIRQNQHLYGQLVPQWYSKNHYTYFQDEQIQKNNTLKFYCG